MNPDSQEMQRARAELFQDHDPGQLALRTVDRHPLASVGTLVLGLRSLVVPRLGADDTGSVRGPAGGERQGLDRLTRRRAVMPGKRVRFDDETWHALNLLARDRMQDFQELADEAFRNQLQKHGRPTDLKTALRRSAGVDAVAEKLPKKTKGRAKR